MNNIKEPDDAIFRRCYNKRALLNHPDFYEYKDVVERILSDKVLYNLHEVYNLVTRELLKKG
jgi:hypothetical protein